MTPEQRFVRFVFTRCAQGCAWKRHYWAQMHERVEVTDHDIRIVDTHPDQPGKLLLAIDLTTEPVNRFEYRSSVYPFLDGHRLRACLPFAVHRLRKELALEASR
jgi:hypothetical protein